MSRASTTPVVVLGKDRLGRPTRVSVAGSRPGVPVVSAGCRLGTIAADGTTIDWKAAPGEGNFRDYDAIISGQAAAKYGRRWSASYIDGKLAALVVPPLPGRK